MIHMTTTSTSVAKLFTDDELGCAGLGRQRDMAGARRRRAFCSVPAGLLTDDETLARLFRLNQERAKAESKAAAQVKVRVPGSSDHRFR